MTPEKSIVLVTALSALLAGVAGPSAGAADEAAPSPAPLPAKEGRTVAPPSPSPIASPAPQPPAPSPITASPAPSPIPSAPAPSPITSPPAPSPAAEEEPAPPPSSYTSPPPEPPAASTAPPTTHAASDSPDPYGWHPPEGHARDVQAKPKPVGFDDAVKLYNQGKYAQAMSKLTGFVKYGTDNDDVHFYIAACHQGLKQYDKAIKEYEALAKQTPFISVRKRAEAAAYTLKCYRQGVCPGQCLKANDPRWRWDTRPGADPTKKVIVFFSKQGQKFIEQRAIGHVIVVERGNPTDKGPCPMCKGTTRVPQLK